MQHEWSDKYGYCLECQQNRVAYGRDWPDRSQDKTEEKEEQTCC